ncbi:MATE family efflux transporter [Christensenella massiliensis]|uniref:MATE family efflux transporter n=2 Tax=Christensenella massiliensis TaxID=1805714 RepID=A0AAU8ABI8_9FIRM
MVDSAVVGCFISEHVLSTVGASYYSLTNIFICVALGGGIGVSVIVSRYFGAKNFVLCSASRTVVVWNFNIRYALIQL